MRGRWINEGRQEEGERKIRARWVEEKGEWEGDEQDEEKRNRWNTEKR